MGANVLAGEALPQGQQWIGVTSNVAAVPDGDLPFFEVMKIADAHLYPTKGNAQICVINAWLRANDPTSPYLPENGWTNDPAGYRCPDEPEKRP